MNRRIFIAGALAAAASPAAAQRYQSVSAGVSGALNARTIGKFVAEVARNRGKTIELNVTGAEAPEPGGTFDIGEGQNNELAIEYRTGRSATFIKVTEAFQKAGRNPTRYTLSGYYFVRSDRSGTNANFRTFVLDSVSTQAVDPGDFPKIKL